MCAGKKSEGGYYAAFEESPLSRIWTHAECRAERKNRKIHCGAVGAARRAARQKPCSHWCRKLVHLAGRRACAPYGPVLFTLHHG